MKFNWNYPTTVWVGENRIKDLVDGCINLQISKPLFVTDKDLVNLPFIIKIISEWFKPFSISVVTFKFFEFIQNLNSSIVNLMIK